MKTYMKYTMFALLGTLLACNSPMDVDTPRDIRFDPAEKWEQLEVTSVSLIWNKPPAKITTTHNLLAKTKVLKSDDKLYLLIENAEVYTPSDKLSLITLSSLSINIDTMEIKETSIFFDKGVDEKTGAELEFDFGFKKTVVPDNVLNVMELAIDPDRNNKTINSKIDIIAYPIGRLWDISGDLTIEYK